MAEALLPTGWFILKTLPALLVSGGLGFYTGYKDSGMRMTVMTLAGIVIAAAVYSLQILVPKDIFTISIVGGVALFAFGNLVVFSLLRNRGERVRKPHREMLQDYKGWNGHPKPKK